MIFGFPFWLVILMIWCEFSGEDSDSNETEEEE
jgi:hypothetical protein